MIELPVDTVSERLIEKLEVLAERILAKSRQHKDPEMMALHQNFWIIIRYLKKDEDISLADIDL